MRLTLQRQCDGDHDNPDAPRCEVRLDVETEIADRLDPRGFQTAWVDIATTMGWRSYGSGGSPKSISSAGEMHVVPLVGEGAWIMCPACVAKGGYVCARCGAADCYCMGGPRFEVMKR